MATACPFLRRAWRWIPFRLPFVCAFYLALVFALFLLDEAIVQPHPVFAHGGHRVDPHSLWRATSLAWKYAICLGPIAALDLLVQVARGRGPEYDLACYPTLMGLRAAMGTVRSRLVLICGVGATLYYACDMAVAVHAYNSGPHGILYPPHYLLVTCLALWAVAWLADTISRPGAGTVVAAVGFVACSVPLLAGAALGWCVE